MIKRRWPFFAALGLTPIVLLIAFISSGVGHGDYVAARLLLPFACVGIGHYAGWVIDSLAILQWPAYGLFISWTNRKLGVISILFLAHFSAVIWLFTKGSEAFA